MICQAGLDKNFMLKTLLRPFWEFSNRSANCTFLLIHRFGNPHLAKAKLRFPCLV